MKPFDQRLARGRSRSLASIGAAGVALLAVVALAGSASSATPTTVQLGTAGQFGLLAGSGATNSGQSAITGDVGSSPTSSETGFTACPAANCVTLIGTNHTDPNPNDATTQGAKAALTTAYNDAAGRSPTTIVTELGGQTLVAGVYSAASGTFGMTGTLVLDGEDNYDAVFIFQTNSTLITGGAGSITLTRHAQACNIFWKVGSAATLGAGSTFRGTILAHDDISLGDGVTVDGRLLAGEQGSGAGAVTLIHDTITKPTKCISQAAADAASRAEAEAVQAAAAKAAAEKAAADAAAAAVVEAARVEAARVAAVEAARVAAVEAAKVEAARVAAVEAAKVEAAKVATVKATIAAKVAGAVAAKKRALKRAGATTTGYARPAKRRAGFTG